MPRIHLIGGEKGGVGKSFFARVLIHYCIDHKLPYILVDADVTNPDVKKLYAKDAHETVFSEAQKKAHEADLIFELALKKPVIVNLAAQVYPLVTEWISQNRLLEISGEYGIDLVKWFVCSGGYDSVALFKESVNHFKERLPHVFVRNFGLTDEWEFLDEDAEFKDLLSKYQQSIQLVDFPRCTYKERYYLDAYQLTFESAFKNGKMPILSKQRLQTFLEKSCEAIAQTGKLVPEKQPSK
ncbi:MAG: mobilization protein [Microcystaceae cyanobacterium]